MQKIATVSLGVSKVKFLIVLTSFSFLFAGCATSIENSATPTVSDDLEVIETPTVEATPTPTPTSYRQLITNSILYEEAQVVICEQLSSEISSQKNTLEKYNSEVQSLDEEPRAAQKGLSKIDWNTNENYRVRLGEDIEEKIIWQNFSSSFDGIELDKTLFDEFIEVIISSCDLSLEWEQVRTTANILDSKLVKLNSASRLVPWYPDGFEEKTSGIAFKVKKGGLDCYSCRGLIYEVIAKNGCLNRLYVQANFLTSSGTVYDWSNDVVYNLGPGQKALIELITYRESGGSGKVQITEISCS